MLSAVRMEVLNIVIDVAVPQPVGRRLPPPPRSGLAWWSGVFGGNWKNLQTARGRNFDCALAYCPGQREPGWSQFSTVGRNLGTSDFHNGGLQIFASMRLFPTDECPKALGKDVWRRAAEGAFDGHWENCARALKTNYPNMLVLRPGWEYNMAGYQWNLTMLAATSLSAAQRQIERDWYKTAFRRWVTIFRQLYSQDVLIDWCGIERGGQAGSIDDFYPGNDVVDIIGVDMYDGQPCLSSEEIWTRDFNTTFQGGPGGVNAWLAYARSKGKPLSFPEWGVSSLGAGADRVPDNAFYIRKMLEFISANAQHIAYEAYANYEGHTLDADGVVKDGVLVKNPECRATYLNFYQSWRALATAS